MNPTGSWSLGVRQMTNDKRPEGPVLTTRGSCPPPDRRRRRWEVGVNTPMRSRGWACRRWWRCRLLQVGFSGVVETPPCG